MDQDTAPRRFQLNQTVIEDVRTGDAATACDWKPVLTDLLAQLGPRAHVYPSENYFYFQFFRGGRSWSGNLRFPVDSRDAGVIQFVCYETYSRWLESHHHGVERELGPADGIRLTRTGLLEYRLEFDGRSTTFSLNRLDQTPNPAILEPGEEFAGRALDESGLGFDILYLPARKAFLFVLGEAGPPAEAFVEIEPDILLGRRTGFLFFRERGRDRLLLIAVQNEETEANTHNDGPFDHLPENDYRALAFLDRVYDAYPDMRGRLTEGGTIRGSGLIFGLAPYRTYVDHADLGFIAACRGSGVDPVEIRLCLTGEVEPPLASDTPALTPQS